MLLLNKDLNVNFLSPLCDKNPFKETGLFICYMMNMRCSYVTHINNHISLSQFQLFIKRHLKQKSLKETLRVMIFEARGCSFIIMSLH